MSPIEKRTTAVTVLVIFGNIRTQHLFDIMCCRCVKRSPRWLLAAVGAFSPFGTAAVRFDMRSFLDLLVKVGIRMLVAVGILLVADLLALSIYTIRKGESDESEGKALVTDESVTADGKGTLGTTRQIVAARYRTKKKILANRNAFISDDSLAAGTATTGQRMMTYGIKLLFVLFWLVFVSWGMMEIKTIGTVLIILPSIWFFKNVRLWRQGEKEAKERIAKNMENQKSDVDKREITPH
jgi:hypothetical protein